VKLTCGARVVVCVGVLLPAPAAKNATAKAAAAHTTMAPPSFSMI
jgi:hypothetical protein